MDFPITIVVPCYNREKYVMHTLRDIQAQTFRPLRVVLVDNNSTDSTLSLLQQWKREVEAPDFQVEIRSESIPGASAARNCGARGCATPYLMFFDSDDRMAPNHVERAMCCFLSPQVPDMVGWDIRLVYGEKVKRVPFSKKHPLWATIFDGSTSTQRYAMRTSLFERSGGWNNDIQGWDDIELGTRLLMLNPAIMKAPGAPTVDYIYHPTSITGADFLSGADKWESALDAMERTLTSPRHRRWINLRRALLAGSYAADERRLSAPGVRRVAVSGERSPNVPSETIPRSQQLLRKALASEHSPFYRALMRLCYRRKLHGRRALSPLLRILC